MKLMTFNTQHCWNYTEKYIDYQVMADAIKACNPDIVALNEMRDRGKSEAYAPQAEILSKRTGIPYHYFARAIYFKEENPYGNAILSRYPFETVETIMVPDPNPRTGTRYYETRCLLKATLANGLTVLVTHFGLNRDEQLNAVETVVANLKDEKCILMGDFNVRPENPILEPIRAQMKDAAECFAEPLLSFPSDNPRSKIDYIFVSPDIELVEADIPAIVAADHRPHTAVVNVPGL